jgi:glycosyltransferase involved in cell wall biosynthesis
MNIGMIGHLKYAIREPFAGGLEMHTHLLATALRARGHRVTLFAAAGSDPAAGVVALAPPTGVNSAASEAAEQLAYAGLMDRLVDSDFDIIHNNSLHHVPLERCGDLPMPMVTTLHTPPFDSLAGGALRLATSVGRRFHRFVAISKTLAMQWAPVVTIDAVIANGVDLSDFLFMPVPARARYWVWHGRIVPEKGLHIAIDAAVAAGVALRFAGPISDVDYFERAIVPRLSGLVSYAGHLTHPALAVLVGGARVCLCTPRWDEPFGLVIAEALACGTPVAGFRRGALPELLDASCGVLIEGEDPHLLAGAALAAERLDRAACHARAASCWDAGRMVGQYEELYAGLSERDVVRRAA